MSANIPQRAAMQLHYASYQGAIARRDAGVGSVMGTNADGVNHDEDLNGLGTKGYNNTQASSGRRSGHDSDSQSPQKRHGV
jgi:hypothetical protein